eukprot:9177357-Alexandrium_andersonii.AAC.1
MSASLVGSEMCIRDSCVGLQIVCHLQFDGDGPVEAHHLHRVADGEDTTSRQQGVAGGSEQLEAVKPSPLLVDPVVVGTVQGIPPVPSDDEGT